jgi:hypothetical protein
MGEPASQLPPGRQQEREVVEAGVAGRGTRARLLDEHEQLGAARAKRRTIVVALDHVEPDRRAVVVERALQVRDRQVHGAESEPGGQSAHGTNASRPAVS